MSAPYACRPEQSRGRLHREPESAGRSPFQRDRDRIVHSGAFRKLQYKTQVFVYHEGDYYRTRLTHSLEVAQIARSVARRLNLDEDLAEAIALAHDLGHTPFGHAGEVALNECMMEAAPAAGGFTHNDQSLRILTRLERRYAGFDGLNLTWEALEGVVKHNGPPLPLPDGSILAPSVVALNQQVDLELDRQPGAEAQVAAMADGIAYNNHDIDDGLRAGLFSPNDLLELPLIGDIVREVETLHPGLDDRRLAHETVRRLIDRMVGDLLQETGRRLAALAPESPDSVRAAPHPVVAFSDRLRDGDRVLRDFLFERMYRHYRVNRETSKARRIVRELFGLLMTEPECLPTEWRVSAQTLATTERARLVADYIAGMTDRYALLEYQRLFELSHRM